MDLSRVVDATRQRGSRSHARVWGGVHIVGRASDPSARFGTTVAMIRVDATAARITRVARARATNDGAHLVVTTGMLHRTRPEWIRRENRVRSS